MWNKASSWAELKNIEMKVAKINVNCDSEHEERCSKTKILEPDKIRSSAHRHRRIVCPPIRNKDCASVSNAGASRSQESVAGETYIDRGR